MVLSAPDIQPLTVVVGCVGRIDLGYGRLWRPNPRLCEYSSALRLPYAVVIIKGAKHSWKYSAKKKRKALQYSHSLGFERRRRSYPRTVIKKKTQPRSAVKYTCVSIPKGKKASALRRAWSACGCFMERYHQNIFRARSVSHIHSGQNPMKRITESVSDDVPVAT